MDEGHYFLVKADGGKYEGLESLFNCCSQCVESSHYDVYHLEFSAKSVYLNSECTVPACAAISLHTATQLWDFEVSSCSGENMSASKCP